MATAVERVREVFALVDRMDVDALVGRYAPDAVMELPFAPGSMPKRYDGGDAIRGFMAFVRDSFSSFSMVVDAVHETTDPSLVIVEHHSDGVVAANGRPYRNRYVTFVRFDDHGRVVHWREHYDAGEIVRAFRP
jgi:ketosteroid isomerase-like protein